MKRVLTAMGCCAAMTAVCGVGIGQVAEVAKPDLAQIKRELVAVVGAVFRADIETIEKHTHERVIAMAGNREAFVAELKQAFSQYEKLRISLVSVEVGEEMEVFGGAEHEFVLMEASITFKVGDEVQEPTVGRHLGVRKKGEAGAVWKYFDCSGFTTDMAREWFPDFPKDRELPVAEE